MATNPFFESSFKSQHDQDLYESLVIESIQVHGRDYLYMPRTLVNFDRLFGEDVISAFEEAIPVEMYLESVSGWEGEQELITKFGISLYDEASLVVSKKRFHDEIGKKFGFKHPREGDLIVFPIEVDKRIRIFEISFVDPEAVFYQLGKLYTYRLKVRVFDYNGESIRTGIKDIDMYEVKHKITQTIELDHGTGDFYPGDVIYQGESFEAVVLSWNKDEQKLVITSNESENALDASPDTNMPIITDSGTMWYMHKVDDRAENIGTADNKLIEANAEILVDESEYNPYLR